MNVYWYALIGAIIFLLLSPGVLLTVPNAKGCSAMSPLMAGKKECATSGTAVAVHAALFGVVMLIIIFVLKHKTKKDKSGSSGSKI